MKNLTQNIESNIFFYFYLYYNGNACRLENRVYAYFNVALNWTFANQPISLVLKKNDFRVNNIGIAEKLSQNFVHLFFTICYSMKRFFSNFDTITISVPNSNRNHPKNIFFKSDVDCRRWVYSILHLDFSEVCFYDNSHAFAYLFP